MSPRFAVIEPLPVGMVEHASLASVIARAVELLEGRHFVLVCAKAGYRGCDTLSVLRLYAPSKEPGSGERPSAVCTLIAGEAPPLRFIEKSIDRLLERGGRPTARTLALIELESRHA